jgi:hypothetical protein
MLYIFRAVVYYIDLLVYQLLHNYFIISNMFRPQLYGHHQGERFFRQQAAYDNEHHTLLVV